MMAQYSRQVNLDTEVMEERTLSPTCEVLSDEARTVSFVTPALSYRVRSTSFWKGRSGLEKLLIVIVAALLILCCSCVIALMIAKQENYELNFSPQWNQILTYGFSFQLHFNALYGSLGLHLMNLDENFLFIKTFRSGVQISVFCIPESPLVKMTTVSQKTRALLRSTSTRTWRSRVCA